jgi:hypothetical protein
MDKQNRHEYYLKNKERINRIARDRYIKKKTDPEFYQSVLLKNKEAYYKKVNKYLSPVLTPEEEEALFEKIKRDTRIATESSSYKEPILSYKTIHELFFES